MTIVIADNSPRISYVATAGQTVFTVPFEFFDDLDVNLYINDVLKVIETDYTVSGGDGSTGTLILVTGATLNDVIVITRSIELERVTDFPTSGPFQVNSLNVELDKHIAMIADLQDLANRGLRLSDSDTTLSLTLASKDVRKGTVLAFNATTGAVEVGPTIADTNTVAQIKADISTVAGISADVTTVAGQSAAITTVIANLAAIQTAPASATAAATSASNAATSETNAAASESNAATSEGNAATSASQASTSASNASTSASNASTSESNASASASAASTSESNASSSASAAGVSETNAAASAAAAAATLDNFDDRYLGAKASDPTLDNDGNALVTGALYFNTTLQQMRVYDGSEWIPAASEVQSTLSHFNFTATASQTTFTGADDNANTLSYVVNSMIVTLNGVVLENGADYTATNTTSIVLSVAASVGDEVNVIAFKPFVIADMVSASNGGTFQNDVTVQGVLTANSITTAGTVDGRDVSVDGTKLDGINQALSTTSDVVFNTLNTFDPADFLRVAASSLANDGYVKLSNGLIIQWGRDTLTSGSGQSITWPTAFVSTPFISFGVEVSDANSTANISGGARSATAWTNIDTASAGTYHWIAIGV